MRLNAATVSSELFVMASEFKRYSAQGKRRRSTEGAEGTNKGHNNAEGMALLGVRLTAQLGHGFSRQKLHSEVVQLFSNCLDLLNDELE